MAYVILYAPEFKREFRKLSERIQDSIIIRGRLFEEDPFHLLLKTHKLTGALRDYWSFSVDFRIRIIFRFASKQEIILVRVGDHSIYRKKRA